MIPETEKMVLGRQVVQQLLPELGPLHVILKQLKTCMETFSDPRDTPYYRLHHVLSGIVDGAERHLLEGSFEKTAMILQHSVADLRLQANEAQITQEELKPSAALETLRARFAEVLRQHGLAGHP